MAKTYSDLFADVKNSVRTISLDELKERLARPSPPTLVDVREKDEVRAGFIPGAIHIPRGFLEMQAEQKLADKSAEIVVYCASRTCQNSHIAAKVLEQLGYTQVAVYAGGKQDWQEAGLALEREAVQPA
jgi:rhodanese-related sulfurtransferase